MKIPHKIIGIHKLRDAAICLEFERLINDSDYTMIKDIQKAVAEKFKLSERRILQIVRANHAYIPMDKEWEKRKRINLLKNEIKKKEKEGSKKDLADLLDQLRVETEGNKLEHSGKIDTGEARIVIISNEGNKGNSSNSEGLSREVFTER